MKWINTIGRFLSLAISLPGLILCLMLTLIAMLWWQLVGCAAWILGSRGRFHVGRWFGCYPFAYTLLLTLLVAAWFHWGATGEKIRPTFADYCANCIDRLETEQGLAKIGGLW